SAIAARPVLARLPGRIGRSAALLPKRRLARLAPAAEVEAAAPASRRRPRVAVLAGCVGSALAPSIHAASLRLLERAGADAIARSGCCGALLRHLGRAAQNRALAAGLTEKRYADVERGRIVAIVAHASGCGTHVKDYGNLFR